MLMSQCALLFSLVFLDLLLHSLIPPVNSAPEDENDQENFFDALFDASSPKYLPAGSLSPTLSDGNSQESSEGKGNASEMLQLQSPTAAFAARSSSKRPAAVIDDDVTNNKAYKKSKTRTSLEPPAVQHSARSHGHIVNHGKVIRDRDGRAVHRTKLLEYFHKNLLPHLQLIDLDKNVVEFAKDKLGSRFIQQMLERVHAKGIDESFFNEIIQNAQPLMIDLYGNHVIGKVFKYATEEQEQQLMQSIRGKVMNLALHKYGCRVIQEALESLDKHGQLEIIHELSMSSRVLKCIKDPNGNHVLQKIIERVEPRDLQFIIDALIAGTPDIVCSLSTNMYASRIIQGIIKNYNGAQKRQIVEKLHENFPKLVMDPFGTYVIQCAIEHGNLEVRERFGQQMRGNVLKYAQNKFASVVIEKFLKYGSAEQTNLLIDEVFVDIGSQNPPFLKMIRDRFGNYVINKMLDVTDSAHKEKMMFAIKEHFPVLLNSFYGKQIITKMKNYFQEENPAIAPLDIANSNA